MGIFSYTPLRPGRGVKKGDPGLRRPFLFLARFFEQFFNFIKINFLFLITCLPLITIGPSICGLTYFSKCVTEEVHMFLLSEYIEQFRKNFFKGLFASVINLIPLYSLWVIWNNMGSVPHFSMLLFPLILVNVVIIIMSFYIYPMIISYDLPLWAIYKNAFIFTMIKLPFNILIFALFLLTIVGITALYIWLGELLLPIIGYGLTLVVTTILALIVTMSYLNYLTTFSVWPTIKKYMEE